MTYRRRQTKQRVVEDADPYGLTVNQPCAAEYGVRGTRAGRGMPTRPRGRRPLSRLRRQLPLRRGAFGAGRYICATPWVRGGRTQIAIKNAPLGAFSPFPKPLALGASDEISPRSGHFSGRVGADGEVGEAGGRTTLRGRNRPKSAFLWGSTPFLWARPKKWGGFAAWGIDHRPVQASSSQPKKLPPAQNRRKARRCRGAFGLYKPGGGGI